MRPDLPELSCKLPARALVVCEDRPEPARLFLTVVGTIFFPSPAGGGAGVPRGLRAPRPPRAPESQIPIYTLNIKLHKVVHAKAVLARCASVRIRYIVRVCTLKSHPRMLRF